MTWRYRDESGLRVVSNYQSVFRRGTTPKTAPVYVEEEKVEVLEPVLCKGLPKEADFSALDSLATTIAEKHKERNFA